MGRDERTGKDREWGESVVGGGGDICGGVWVEIHAGGDAAARDGRIFGDSELSDSAGAEEMAEVSALVGGDMCRGGRHSVDMRVDQSGQVHVYGDARYRAGRHISEVERKWTGG